MDRNGVWHGDICMEIREIFDNNIRLLGYIDKAVVLFRQGRYDEALGMVAESGEGINRVCDAVLADRTYFGGISADFVGEMLESVLKAKKDRDYILLADLYELQLSAFITGIQEYIVGKEDFFDFDVEKYNEKIKKLEQKLTAGFDSLPGTDIEDDERERLRVNRNAELEAPLMPEELLGGGYSVEFSSCGLMTVRAPMSGGGSIYLHSNGNIMRESFLLADRFRQEQVSHYIVFGFGLGYHIEELLELDKFARVTVFESDINVLKLFCAFSGSELLDNRRLCIVYDPDRTLIEQRIASLENDEKACVHYPSMRRAASGKRLMSVAPFSSIVERC